MIIQYCSDLHIEYVNKIHINPLNYIKPIGDILILAGDIGSFYFLLQLENFIKPLSKFFQYIFYVPGNHEYYYTKNYYLAKKTIDQLYENILVLEKKLKIYTF